MKEFGLNFLLTFLILSLLVMISSLIEGGIIGMWTLFLLPLITIISLINTVFLAFADMFITNTKARIILTFLPTLIVSVSFLGFLPMAIEEDGGFSIIFSLIVAVFISNFLRYKRITKI